MDTSYDLESEIPNFPLTLPNNLHDDDDDSPRVTDDALLIDGCPYQQTITAVRDDTFAELDNAVLYKALCSIIASNDPAGPNALYYLFSAGAPRESLPGKEPFAVLAARRHEHPAYTDMLVMLASAEVDFGASSTTGESAEEILNERAPGLFKLVLKAAQEHNSPL